MAATAPTGKAALAVEEARLARGAAAGDGSAFAALYGRYEQRAYNLAYRITGSEPDAADATEEAFLATTMRRLPDQDREPAFGSRLLTATRNACYDLMEKRQPAQPSEETPETRPKEVRDANTRLPARQREALALRELEELSYDEIAATMEMHPHSVAKLIYRARVNLSDELHGTALAAVAAPSPECERALSLIAAREDGQLEAGSDDNAWLDAHLTRCERCGLGVEAMKEAGASYRAWAPIAALPWMLEETMTKAAALAGADWSEEIAEATASRTDPQPAAGMPPAYPSNRAGGGWSSRRRRAIAAAGLGALLLGVGVAAALVGAKSSPIAPKLVADSHRAGSPPGSKPDSKQKERRGPRKAAPTETASQATTIASTLTPIEAGGGAPSEPSAAPADHQGVSGLEPPQATSAPKPKPTPTTPTQPASAPAPPAETQAPAAAPIEEPAPEHPGKGKGPPPGVPKGGH
jgi:RNA polymerase sigma-70 factor (ECF subfamily)